MAGVLPSPSPPPCGPPLYIALGANAPLQNSRYSIIVLSGLRGLAISVFVFHVITAFTCETRTTVWPSGLRRWLKAPVRKGVGSNPTAVNQFLGKGVKVMMTSSAIDFVCLAFGVFRFRKRKK